jgi:hypothetical protein
LKAFDIGELGIMLISLVGMQRRQPVAGRG